jgi:hypothetical protein
MLIAAIALLMAILMPALQIASVQAKKVTCSNNLKQSGPSIATIKKERWSYRFTIPINSDIIRP